MKDVTLAVLAGGEGTRMGIPKAWLTINGQPILRWLMARWDWRGPTLLVTAPGRENPPGAEQFDREAVDPMAEEGPLRGIATALGSSQSGITVIATCDMPMVGREQLEWLGEQLRAHTPALGVFAKPASGVEPFPCAMRKSAISVIRQRLETDQRSVQSLVRLADFLLLAAPDDWPSETWMNLNTPQDVDAFQAKPSTRAERS